MARGYMGKILNVDLSKVNLKTKRSMKGYAVISSAGTA